MNTLYALIVVTATAANEAYVFTNSADCERASAKIANSFCTPKQPVDIEREAARFFTVFKNFVQQMEALDEPRSTTNGRPAR